MQTIKPANQHLHLPYYNITISKTTTDSYHYKNIPQKGLEEHDEELSTATWPHLMPTKNEHPQHSLELVRSMEAPNPNPQAPKKSL